MPANRIRELRLLRGISQVEMARLLVVARSGFTKMERGERRLSPKWRDRIAAVLQVAPEQLEICNPQTLVWAPVITASRIVADAIEFYDADDGHRRYDDDVPGEPGEPGEEDAEADADADAEAEAEAEAEADVAEFRPFTMSRDTRFVPVPYRWASVFALTLSDGSMGDFPTVAVDYQDRDLVHDKMYLLRLPDYGVTARRYRATPLPPCFVSQRERETPPIYDIADVQVIGRIVYTFKMI